MNDKSVTLDWYKTNFINIDKASNEIAIYAGMNMKTINNIYNSNAKNIVIDVAKSNFDYLSHLITQMEDDPDKNWNLSIKLEYKSISVDYL